MELPILDNLALRDALETSRYGAPESEPGGGESSFAQHLASSPSESSTTATTPHTTRAESREDEQRSPQDAGHESSDASASVGPPPPQDARHDREVRGSAETDSGETHANDETATTDSPTTTPGTNGTAVSATPLPTGEKTSTQQTAADDASTAAPGPASVTGSATPPTPQARQTEPKFAPTTNASHTEPADTDSVLPAEITAAIAAATQQTTDQEITDQETADRLTTVEADALAVASLTTAEELRGPTPGKSLPRTDRAQNAEKHAARGLSEAKSGDDSAGVSGAAQQSQPPDASAEAPADIDLTARQTDEVPSPDSKTASTSADASRATTPAERLPDHLLTRATNRPAANADATHVDQTRLIQRVARAIEAAPQHGGTIRLRLSPPELGSLQVEVTVRKGALSARLEAETQAARAVLLDNLPQLRDRLAEQGLRIDQFEVNVSQRDAGDGRHPSHDYGSEHQSPLPHQTARVSPETASDSDTAARTRRFLHPGNLNIVI